MPEAHEVFAAIRKSKQLKQKDFVGIASRATIGRFEQGEGDLPVQVLIRALKKMNVTLGEFVTRMESEESDGYHSHNIPIYGWADIGKDDPEPQGSVYYPKGAKIDAYALRVRDAAMISADLSLNYPVGDYIIVEPMQRVNDDSLVIVCVGGAHHFRRKYRGKYVPANADFETIESGEVVGRVIGRVGHE
ncbi:S24 family peptidase [Vibrio vulnificus]